MGHMGGVLQISYLIKHGSDAYAMHDALLIACSWHSSQTGTPPSPWRRIARIWGSLYLVIFIKISSDILPRKFYFRIPLVSGGITQASSSTRNPAMKKVWVRQCQIRASAFNRARRRDRPRKRVILVVTAVSSIKISLCGSRHILG